MDSSPRHHESGSPRSPHPARRPSLPPLDLLPGCTVDRSPAEEQARAIDRDGARDQAHRIARPLTATCHATRRWTWVSP